MNKKRLLKLADLLDKNAANKKGLKFNLHNWGDSVVADDQTSGLIRSVDGNVRFTMDCNTTACGMGLAAISGAFKRAGLEYIISLHGRAAFIYDFEMKGVAMDGIEAAMELFGISRSQALALFVGDGQKRIRGVAAEMELARRIRYFVEYRVVPYYVRHNEDDIVILREDDGYIREYRLRPGYYAGNPARWVKKSDMVQIKGL